MQTLGNDPWGWGGGGRKSPQKHSPPPQVNNFVIFEGFFSNRPGEFWGVPRLGVRGGGSGDPKSAPPAAPPRRPPPKRPEEQIKPYSLSERDCKWGN